MTAVNLRNDPTESKDLSALEPGRFKKMLAEVEAYHQRAGVVLPEAGYNPLRQLLLNNWQVLVRQLWFVLLPAGLLLLGGGRCCCGGGCDGGALAQAPVSAMPHEPQWLVVSP